MPAPKPPAPGDRGEPNGKLGRPALLRADERRDRAGEKEEEASQPRVTSGDDESHAHAVNTAQVAASNPRQARIKEAEEDRGLIARAQAGDTGAFRALVERHQRRAFAVALSLVRDENDARELVQDAFLRVHKSLPTFQGGSSFFTWLYRIITNLSIDLIRKPGRQTTDLDDSRLELDESAEADFPFLSRVDGADPQDVVRRREIAARLQTALDALPSYHRGVIVMREVEGLSYEEMAVAMGVSKGTIMSRLFHARQKLQRALADCYAEQVGPAGARTSARGASNDDAEGSAADREHEEEA
jgi:RNA polymerase sigma-70 factor (ECF subfamily)